MKLLNEERREKHRELKNATRRQRLFEKDDLVIIRKQVKSNATLGRPEKLILKAKGPYRVIERAGEGRYRVQRLPAVQGLSGRKGKVITEAAIRMERIPSTVVIHKRIDTMDTRMATMKDPLVHNPLEKNLGFFEFGKFAKANPHSDHAFEKIVTMWNEEVENSSSDNDEEDTDIREQGAAEEDNGDEAKEESVDNEDNKDKRGRSRGQFPIWRPKSTRQRLDELWKLIEKSKDKMCIIRKADEKGKYEYHVIQIDMDETSERKAKQKGEYHGKFWIRNFKDSEMMKVRDCRFYPLVRELLKGGWPGAMIMVGPTQVERFLEKHYSKYFWYQMEVNLLDHLVVGPFDFTKDPMWKIPKKAWDTLVERAADMEIEPSKMNCNRKDTIATAKKRKNETTKKTEKRQK